MWVRTCIHPVHPPLIPTSIDRQRIALTRRLLLIVRMCGRTERIAWKHITLPLLALKIIFSPLKLIWASLKVGSLKLGCLSPKIAEASPNSSHSLKIMPPPNPPPPLAHTPFPHPSPHTLLWQTRTFDMQISAHILSLYLVNRMYR